MSDTCTHTYTYLYAYIQVWVEDEMELAWAIHSNDEEITIYKTYFDLLTVWISNEIYSPKQLEIWTSTGG